VVAMTLVTAMTMLMMMTATMTVMTLLIGDDGNGRQ